tara:strand:+ start:671 stop:1711 length:1041 start_codon:yes stop_codon:yes gene_type:complete
MTFNIGGEFDFDKNLYNNKSKKNKFSNLKNYYTINGISAFYQILLRLNKDKIKTIYVPDLICESLLLPIKKLNFKYKFYEINEDLSSTFIPKENTSILVIHYFGTINKGLENLRIESKKKKFCLIEDISHCYLNKNFLFNAKNEFFSSLRKHGIFGPGGLSNVNFNLKNKLTKFENEFLTKSLALRIMKNAHISNEEYISKEQIFLNSFKKINQFFNNRLSNSAINQKYKKNLYDCNITSMVKKRLDNWSYLDSKVGHKFEKIYSHVNENRIPLGYIIFLDKRDLLKKYLMKKRIFCGIHWLSKKIPIKNKSFISKKMMQNSITIPIDHRYGHNDMEYIAETLYKF